MKIIILLVNYLGLNCLIRLSRKKIKFSLVESLKIKSEYLISEIFSIFRYQSAKIL